MLYVLYVVVHLIISVRKASSSCRRSVLLG